MTYDDLPEVPSLLRERAPTFGTLIWNAIPGHRSGAVRVRAKAACPICGSKGYRRIIKRPYEEALFYCRRGHPHYVPLSMRGEIVI